MRIVIGVHHFPPRHTSGAELCAYSTAAWLRDHGHDVYVVCVEATNAGDGHGLTFEDEPYDGLPVRRLSFNLTAASTPFRWTYDNPLIKSHLYDYLAELKPDLLHIVGGYLMSGSSLRAANDLEIPTVVTLTDFWFLCPRINLLRSNGLLCAPPLDAVTCACCLGEERRRFRIPGRVAPALMKAFWRTQRNRIAQVQARMAFLRETLDRVDAVISPSQFLRHVCIEAGIAPERFVFSRQGRDFPDLTPDLLKKRPAAHLRVGYMGQIALHKGVHTLFEAIRQLPGLALEVIVYGDGTPFPGYTERLRRMTRRDPRVRLAGVYGRTDVSRVMQGLDVVVMPSVCYENSPNVILEAFAHLTPVIVSDLGGMAELVEDGVDGLHFRAGDPASLAAKLRLLVDNPGLLLRLREGVRPVKSVMEEMAELLEIYDAVVSRASPHLAGKSGNCDGASHNHRP